jgi:RHS repeat-associated protein
MINYDVPFPVPVFAPQSFAIFLAQVADASGAIIRTPNQLWSQHDLGAQWSPLNTTVIVGDFNGDGKADVLLQSANGTNMLLLSSGSGTGQLQSAVPVAGPGAGWTSGSYHALVGKFGGSSSAVLYLQATNASGTNYITSNLSGTSVTATASVLQIAATSPPAAANGVGITAGQTDVSSNGTGSYTIPLQLPRGTAGLTPELGLQYESSVGNGLLGVGWDISGLSIITRCPQTWAQDNGVTQGVQLLASDQYCLDGKRLRLTSGSQGADGSQYRTELETFSLIIAHGASGNSTGPAWFEVKTKDGQTYEYGNSGTSPGPASPDALVPGANGATRVWALSAIRDRTQNYIHFSYINGQSPGPLTACQETSAAVNNYRLCQITYTGNTAQGTSPPYTIQFSYQPRNNGEVLTHYYVGQQIAEVNRLHQIQLLYSSAVVHSWTLGYDTTATPTNASRISWVQECGENNDCFPASTFTWSTQAWSTQAFPNGTPVVAPSSSTTPPPPSLVVPGCTRSPYGVGYVDQCYSTWPLDINGDGILDYVTYYSAAINNVPTTSTFTLQLGTPKSQTPSSPVPFSGPAQTKGYPVTGGLLDVLSEGKQGFLFNGGCQAECWLHIPAGAAPVVDSANVVVPTATSASVDVNGDGFPDAVYTVQGNNTQLFLSLHNLDGTPGFLAQQPAWTAPANVTIGPVVGQSGGPAGAWPPSGMYTDVLAADFDGDGRQDILVQTSAGWRVLYANGSGFTTGDLIVTPQPYGPTHGYLSPVMIDVNGDGCTDLAYPTSSTTSSTGYVWTVEISKCGVVGGTGFTPPINTGIAAPLTDGSQGSINAIDLNGDGYQDLIYATDNITQVVAYSNGSGFSSPVPIPSACGIVTARPVCSVWMDVDGDGLPDQLLPGGGNAYTAVGPKSDLMLSGTDGFGNAVSFTYAPLTDPTVYTRGQGQMGATQDLDGPMYVVKALQRTDGVGGSYSLTYSYAGAHRNVQGRGFLGFATRTITDSRTGFVTTETYNNTIDSSHGWELAGTLAESKLQQWAAGPQSPAGPVLQDTVNQWTSMVPDGAANRRYPYIRTQTVSHYDLNNSGAPIATQVTTTTIDNYGTPYDVVVTTTEGPSSSSYPNGINSGSSRTEHTSMPQVMNDTADWCLNKPQLIQKTSSHTLTDGVALTHTINEAWDGFYCRMTDKNLEVGSAWEQDTHLDYDNWNNVKKQTVTGTNVSPPRVTLFDYTTSTSPGQFLMTHTNALNQSTKFSWDDARGLPLTQQDPNGFTTSWQYDDFGRQVHQVRADGTGSRRTYFPCKASNSYCGDSLLRFMVQEDERDTGDKPRSYSYLFYDSLGRVKYDETAGFSGALSVVTTLYDARGNVADQSMPYYAGSDRYVGTSFNYDLFNRVTKSQRPTSDSDLTVATAVINYSGLTVTRMDPLGHSQTDVSDAWGDVVRVTDEAGQATSYTYDSFNHLKSTTDAKGNQSTLSYNVRGFKMGLNDPDMGSWSYTYDGLGEMLTQTDAKGQLNGQQTKFHYDALGRLDSRADPGASSWDTVWSWDTGANGIGQLGSVTGPSGYSQAYSYGANQTVQAGKMTSTQVTASGTTYGIDYTFDPQLGKVQTITYPISSSGGTASRFAVWYDYNNYGYLQDAKDYTVPASPVVLWQATLQDARGHVTQANLGNGQQSNQSFDKTTGLLNSVQTGPNGGAATQNLYYSWDRVGNLISRADANQNLTEAFGYDALYRLQSVSLNGNPTPTLWMSYDAIGNVTNKSDVGLYDYTTAQSACNYSGLSAQPHAVRNAAGSVYCYDANGNMIYRSGATVSWYAYNLPQTINQVGGNYSTFYYAPDRSRYRQTSLNGATTEDRIYVAGLFEQLTSSTAGQVTTEYRHYIVANGQKVAIRLVNSAGPETLYLHDDHLGSTDTITDHAGKVKIHESYDAWGKRRGSAWTGTPSAPDWSTINSTTHIGFTGQEMLDNLSLVDLNGRVYDPVIARFMSADPYVQAPYRSQSLNRYSYTWNNPLNQTDPTGFENDDNKPGRCIRSGHLM